MELQEKDFIKVIDHTYLKTEKEGVSLQEQELEVRSLVADAVRYGTFSVCVREHMASIAKEEILKSNSDVKVCCVVGFPIGDEFTTDQKIEFVKQARNGGAVEFDMVLKANDLKNGNFDSVLKDIEAVSTVVGSDVLKVIFENSYLNNSQKIKAVEICLEAFKNTTGFEKRFIKTSTGFAKVEKGMPIGATLDDVTLMSKYSKGVVGIKPAGGVGSLHDARAFFEAVGSPMTQEGSIDPYKFRIGSSSLLSALSTGKDSKTY